MKRMAWKGCQEGVRGKKSHAENGGNGKKLAPVHRACCVVSSQQTPPDRKRERGKGKNGTPSEGVKVSDRSRILKAK
jgi:hypothetical protein